MDTRKQVCLSVCFLFFVLFFPVSCTFQFLYFFFHFVTDEGITLTWHPEAGKPFVTELIGNFAVLFLFASGMSLLIAFLFCEKEQ